ncbi:kinase, PfkB family [[Eubacterium] siraeum DSM 15702]|jgi:2-dehydro-3-deoxygluconokinase|uniref:Kinase, PfkB family n=1 Tax=[Eubacterium] siraeum DSM 15702 TaxID=428128 RepID=B0MS85_9FIRM|nr:kinase, PfkB family [[Eubacterium] siraeum DSM 15702]UWP26084.1 sugar kinase [[Eubacterium] siraeum]
MKVVSFGEIMLRLSPDGYYKLFQKPELNTSFCGAEANVAVALSNFGDEAEFVTALPDNDIGRAACRELMRYGVKTDNIVYTGDRLGIFFAEKGASQRPSKVIYDRKNSAIALAEPSSFDWEKIFDGADWFHITGITPALSDSLAKISVDAVKAAKKAGLTVSCDINYRSKLWSAQKARPVMTEIMKYVDVCIGNEEDAEIVFGIKAGTTDVTKGQLDTDGYKKSLQTVAETFGCKIVAYSQRKSYSASDNGWSGIIYDDEKKQVYTSAQYDIRITDRIGGGDAFASGLIYALHNNISPANAIETAAAAGCLDQTLEGDFCLFGINDVIDLAGGNSSGRVKR